MAIDRLTKGGRLLTGDEDAGTLRKWAIRWWEEPGDRSWPELVLTKGRTMPDGLPSLEGFLPMFSPYGADERPVFIGHYYMKPETPAPFGQVACVDFSVAEGGFLCAYRWSFGETALEGSNFFTVDSRAGL